MIRIGAWVYDFKGMAGYFMPQHDVQVYNGVDEVHLVLVDNKLTGQMIGTWEPIELIDEEKVNKAYNQWLYDQIDNIIL